MTRIVLAISALAAVLMTGCGESTNSSDGAKLAHFKNDRLFAFQPAGAVMESELVNPGSAGGDRGGAANNFQDRIWAKATDTPPTIMRQYLALLLNEKWSQVAIQCSESDLFPGAPIIQIDAYRDTGTFVAHAQIGNGYVNGDFIRVMIEAPFHSADPYPKPDLDIPPDTACLDALT